MLRMSIVLPLFSKTSNFIKCATNLQSTNLIRFYSKKDDEINGWLQTLDEAQQKRIRFIQNEVNFWANIFRSSFRCKVFIFFAMIFTADIAAARGQRCTDIRFNNQR